MKQADDRSSTQLLSKSVMQLLAPAMSIHALGLFISRNRRGCRREKWCFLNDSGQLKSHQFFEKPARLRDCSDLSERPAFFDIIHPLWLSIISLWHLIWLRLPWRTQHPHFSPRVALSWVFVFESPLTVSIFFGGSFSHVPPYQIHFGVSIYTAYLLPVVVGSGLFYSLG